LNQYIQSGQGFFVKTSGSSPVMTIREQDKVADFNPIAFRGQTNELPLLAINLQYASGASKVLADGVVTAFDNAFSNLVGAEDASKMTNSAEGIAIVNTGALLSIDARKMPTHNDTLFLNVSKLTKPQYTLQIFGKGMEGSMVMPFLEDRYLNTTQPLSLNDTNRIDFNVTPSIAASFDAKRFRIVFRSSELLPVRFTSVKATQKNEDILVKWDIAEESNISKYEIERSADGINFSKVGQVASKGNNLIENYEWLDENPATANNYYRIRAIDTDGSYFLSRIVVVTIDANGPEIKVYPNPIKNGQLNLYINAEQSGQYTVSLFDSRGVQIIKQTIDHPGGFLRRDISLSKILAGGVYYLQVINKNKKYRQTIMIE
jgi:Secretion system C-terminal sorting domain